MSLVLFGVITVIIAVVTTTAYVVGQKRLSMIDDQLDGIVDQVNKTGKTTYELDKKQEFNLGKQGQNIIDMEKNYATTTQEINKSLNVIGGRLNELGSTDVKLRNDLTTLDNTVKAIPTESQLKRITALEKTNSDQNTWLGTLQNEVSKNLPTLISQNRMAANAAITQVGDRVTANKATQDRVNTDFTTAISNITNWRNNINAWKDGDLASWRSQTTSTLADYKNTWRPGVDRFMANHANVLYDINSIKRDYTPVSSFTPKVAEFTKDITDLKTATNVTIPRDYVKNDTYIPIRDQQDQSINKLFGIVGTDGSRVVTQEQLTNVLAQRNANVSNGMLWTFQETASGQITDLQNKKADKTELDTLNTNFTGFKSALDSFQVTLQDTDASKTPYLQMGKSTTSTNNLNIARANAARQFNDFADVDDIIIRGNNVTKRTIVSGGQRTSGQTPGDIVLRSGNVGIGVKDPAFKLDVNETNANTTGWAAQFHNTNGGVRLGRGDGKALEIYNGQTINIGADINGNLGMNGQLTVGGDLTASRNATIRGSANVTGTLNAGNLQIGGQNVATQAWVNSTMPSTATNLSKTDFLRVGNGPSWHPGNDVNANGTILHGNGQIRSRNNTEAGWSHMLYGKEHKNIHMLHGDGYGMHINTRDNHPDKYSIETYNMDGPTLQIRNDGKQIGWGRQINDWNWRQYNANGGNVHMNHGHGYGIHVNTNNRDSGKYGLEVHNGARPIFRSMNDNHVVVGNGPSWHPGHDVNANGTILHADGQIRSRNNTEGGWSHILYGKEHKNIHMLHGDGYGMHINTRDNHPDKYAIETHNLNGPTFKVMNNGNANIYGNANIRGDLVFNGDNGWIIHTPDDGRKIMYIAPWIGSDWAWYNQVTIDNGGNMSMRRVYQYSDEKLKKDITPIKESEINKINNLSPKSFTWKHSGEKDQFGFIAQDVEKLYPSLVNTNANGNKSVNYDAFVPLLTKNVQNLNKNLPQSDKLCLDDVCITKDELLKLKKQAS
jgi:hypothetical protein